jgi:hypothetical protein
VTSGLLVEWVGDKYDLSRWSSYESYHYHILFIR